MRVTESASVCADKAKQSSQLFLIASQQLIVSNSFLVTTSKALVTTSDALVPNLDVETWHGPDTTPSQVEHFVQEKVDLVEEKGSTDLIRFSLKALQPERQRLGTD